MKYRIEAITLPISDVDRKKALYENLHFEARSPLPCGRSLEARFGTW
jgi:hypothetical protein